MKTTRQLAEDLLHEAKRQFDDTPNNAPAQIVSVHTARAQFFVLAALTNAVLDVADAVRETRRAGES